MIALFYLYGIAIVAALATLGISASADPLKFFCIDIPLLILGWFGYRAAKGGPR